MVTRTIKDVLTVTLNEDTVVVLIVVGRSIMAVLDVEPLLFVSSLAGKLQPQYDRMSTEIILFVAFSNRCVM